MQGVDGFMRAESVAKVIVDIRTKSLDRVFDYRVPHRLDEVVKPGHRVLVSFGPKLHQGFVMDIETASVHEDGRKLKEIVDVQDEQPVLTKELLELTEWLAERYVCSRIEVLQTLLPSAFRQVAMERYRAVPTRAAQVQQDGLGLAATGSGSTWPTGVNQLVRLLSKQALTQGQIVKKLGNEAMVDLRQALAMGVVESAQDVRDRVAEKTQPYVIPIVPLGQLVEAAQTRSQRSPKQSNILSTLVHRWASTDEPTPVVACVDLGLRASDGSVQALVRDGLVRVEQRVVDRSAVSFADSMAQAAAAVEPPRLTSWQERAVASILQVMDERRGGEVVLHGVTGSGKTEVYLRLIERCLNEGRAAIMMVPEIALTPQMVRRFVERFGDQVAVLHSALSQGERRDAWTRLRRGDARVAVGARSAIFAPVADLGLVIVDEEHEPSYKQEETPFYEAREVAHWRVRRAKATVLYGSATPSMEAMARVEQRGARLVTIPERVHGRPMPPVQLVDMRDELREGNTSVFSRALEQGLEACVKEGHQAILFLNRRGYSAFLLCRHCGERIQCPRCDIALTVHRHRSNEWLSCHYCHESEPIPPVCPACGEPALKEFGLGTQQVETLVQERWPGWRVLRMDVDTTRRKGAHQRLIDAFERGDAEILIGTQMVAKGLDFGNVSFVGVLNADTMLAVPDYRANERTFHLLTQVAGRSGRADVPGQTVVQTYMPEHYAITAAARHDYSSFYRRERENREHFHYPPFRELAVFMASHERASYAAGAANRFERELRRRLSAGVDILPAVPSGIARVDDRFRYQVVVKYQEWNDVCSAFHAAYHVVREKMHRLGGTSVLDVQAGRI